MYSNEYEDEQQEESNGSFIVNFYNNNKILVWIFIGIVVFILLMSLLTKGGSNNRNANVNYDVTIVPEGDVFVLLGKSTNLIASVKNDPKAEFIWSVEDETIAKVDNGNVTGLDYGKTKVTATYIDSKNEKHTDTRTVTVAEGDPNTTLADVSFKDGDLFMPLNTTYQIALTLTPSRGYVESEKFTSSNTSVVTVDNKGVVTSVGEGSAVITFDVNNGQFRKELNVYVDRDFNRTEIIITPSRIIFDGELRKIKVGTTDKLSYTIEPENAASDKLTWESSDESVLTVDNGKIRGISQGVAVVTVTALNGTKDRIDIEVENDIVEVTDINVSSSDLYLTVGQSQVITPAVSPANASNKALSFMSLDSSIAYVTPNETGTRATITGINAGSTSIVVRSFNNIEKRLNVIVTGGGNSGGNGGSSSGGSSSSNQGFKISSKDADGIGFVNASYSQIENNCAVAPLKVTVEKTSSSVKKLMVYVCNYDSDSDCEGTPLKKYETTNSVTFSLTSSGDYVFKVEEYNSKDKLTRTTYKYACVGSNGSGSSDSGSSLSNKLYETNKTIYSSASTAQAHPYAVGTEIKFTAHSNVGYIKVCAQVGICTNFTKVTATQPIKFASEGTYTIRIQKFYNDGSQGTEEQKYVTISSKGGSGSGGSGSGGSTGVKANPQVSVTSSLTMNVGEHKAYQVKVISEVPGTFYNELPSNGCVKFNGQNFSETEINGTYRKFNQNYGIDIKGMSECTTKIKVTFKPAKGYADKYNEVVREVKVTVNKPAAKWSCSQVGSYSQTCYYQKYSSKSAMESSLNASTTTVTSTYGCVKVSSPQSYCGVGAGNCYLKYSCTKK